MLFTKILCLATLKLALAQTDDHVETLISWLQEKGGKVSKKVEIRRADPDDPTSPFGYFAKETINPRELVVSVPRELLISEGDIDEDDLIDSPLPCETIFNLIREMKLGNESKYGPYVEYLKAQSYGQIPSSWSEKGKELFERVLGDLPPMDPISWIDHEWYKECEGEQDPFDEQAAMLVLARGWDYTLIPVFDMMNHRNGKWLNTDSNSVHDDSDNIVVRATKRIKTGDQLYTSYNMCRDCGGRVEHYGTPDMFRDYGFVEKFPQRWIFDENFKFDIDEKQDGSGELQIFWHGPKSRRHSDVFLTQRLQKLEKSSKMLMNKGNKVSQQEVDAMKEYIEALNYALTMALNDVGGRDLDDCLDGRSDCKPSIDRYDLLDEDEDEIEGNEVCDNDEIMEFNDYTMAVEVSTHYQDLYFKHNPTTKDTCLDIGDTVQICSNYRPHYHELVTHYPARFVEKVERVLWVGGGDSMLLHEILKYPDIQLAVGLELDQTVTRGSFLHFGSQPHWDNEKVEWWFGDATKSLMMLPEEYFASFDMVLVDLSETVMSLSVTDHLDVFEALSLLLKPEGIMVKNEHYFETMYDVFNYTVELHYHDVPIICSQALSISSSHIDFAKRNFTDHGVETHLLKQVDYGKEHLHHFGRNIAGVQRPHKLYHDTEKDATEQKSSPGILMILEAENVNTDIESAEDLGKAIGEALDNNGFESKLTILNEFDSMAVLVFTEGFVSARYWPEHQYCAYDLHMWSSFEKQNELRKILLGVVGAPIETSSQFRIVAGGMFGIETWKDDLINRGPRPLPEVEDNIVFSEKDEIDSKDVDAIYDEGMAFIREKETALVMICGYKNEDCRGLEVIEQNGSFGKVVPVWACDDLSASDDISMEANEKKFKCEIDLLKQLRRAVSSQNKKFRGIVLDQKVIYSMGQIVYSIFSKYHNQLLTEDVMIFAIKHGDGVDGYEEDDEFWKRSFVDKFREEIIVEEPVFRAEVLFNSSDASIEMDVVSSGDFRFFTTLEGIVENIDSRTGLVSEIRKIYGGDFTHQPDFLMTQFYLPKDYPQEGPFEQWKSQNPIGHQAILQLEISDKFKKASLTYEKVKAGVEHAFQIAISEKKDDSITEYSGAGEGCLFVGIWSGGNVFVLWDGRKHVDINFYVKQDSHTMSKVFLEKFNSKMKIMSTALKDSFPRGTGRVVNFENDIKGQQGKTPIWADHLNEE